MRLAWAPNSSEASPTTENRWFPVIRASLEKGGLHKSMCEGDSMVAGSRAKRTRGRLMNGKQ